MAEGRQPSHYQKGQRENLNLEHKYSTSSTIGEVTANLRKINNGTLWPTPSINVEQQSHEGAIGFSSGQSAVPNTHASITQNPELSRTDSTLKNKNRRSPYVQSVQKSQHGTTSRTASPSATGTTLTKSPKVHNASRSKQGQVNTHRSDGDFTYEVSSKRDYTDPNQRKVDLSSGSYQGSHPGRTVKETNRVTSARQTARTFMEAHSNTEYTTTAELHKAVKPKSKSEHVNTAQPTNSSNFDHSSRINNKETSSSKKKTVSITNSGSNSGTNDTEAIRIKVIKDGSKLEHFKRLQQETFVKPQRQDSSSTINFVNRSGETGNAASFNKLDTGESRQEQENMEVSTSDPGSKLDSIEGRQTAKDSTSIEVESGQSIQEHFNRPRLEEYSITGVDIQTNTNVPDVKLQRTDSNSAPYQLLNSDTKERVSYIGMVECKSTQEHFNVPEPEETSTIDNDSKMDTSEATSPGTSSFTTHSLTKDNDAKLNKTDTPGRRNENENIHLPISVSNYRQPNSTMDNNIKSREETTQPWADSASRTYTGLNYPTPAKGFTDSTSAQPMEVDESTEEVVQSQQSICTAQNQPRSIERAVPLKNPSGKGPRSEITVTLDDIQHEEAIDKLNTKDLKALLLSSGIKSSEINGAEKSFLLSLAKRKWTDRQKASTPSQIRTTTRGFHNSKDEAVPEKHSEHSETHSKPKITDDIYNVQTLSDITSEDIIKKLKPRVIKEILSKHCKKCDNIVEKDELQKNLLELWRNTTGTEQLQKIAKHATSEGASQTIHGNKNPSSSRFDQDQSEKISGEQISKDANRTTQNIPNPRNRHTINEDTLTNRQLKTTTDISNVKILADITSFASIQALGVHEIKEILTQHRVNFSNIREKKDLEKRLLTLWQNSKRTNEKSPKTLADITSEESIRTLSNREIKDILKQHGVDFSNLVEKIELEKCLKSLWEDTKKGTMASTRKHCLICKKETSNCILLNCGHLVTCKQCGFSVKECPVCHQYVVRAVQVFSV